MADTCRHEWVMGSDGCVHCGESWAALHPEDELAPPARRGLNRLLASFPAAEVVHAGRPPMLMNRLAGRDMETPWVWVDLQPGVAGLVHRFAIWKSTGNVYELDEHGAVGDDPVITVTPFERELADSECGHSQLPPTESEIAGSPEVITRRCAVCDRELWWQLDHWRGFRPEPGTPDRIRITRYVPPGMFVLAPYEHDDSMPGLERTVSDDGPHEILCHPDDWAELRSAVGTRQPHDLTGFFGLKVVGEQ